MKELQQLNSDLAALEGGHQDGDLASACLHNTGWTRMTIWLKKFSIETFGVLMRMYCRS